MDSKKVDLKQKITAFNQLMEDIAQEVADIFNEGKEDELKGLATEMIRSLDNAQKVVREAFNRFQTKGEKRN